MLFLVIQFKGIGVVISGFLNIPHNLAILLIGGTIIFYVSTGGMRSVVWTDVIQAIIMLTGVYLFAMLTTSKFGITNYHRMFFSTQSVKAAKATTGIAPHFL